MPYALPAGMLAWWLSLCAAGWWAYGQGRDHEIATQSRESRAAQMAGDAAASAAAAAIARIRVRHQTITQEVQREIVDRPVYRDCGHSAEQLQRINAAIAGEPARPADHGGLPAAGTAD